MDSINKNYLYYLHIFTLAFLSCNFTATAQELNRCNANQFIKMQETKHPEVIQNRSTLNKLVNDQIQKNKTRNYKNSDPLITIPVVFHVLYHNTAENISLAQLQSQIDVLNEDYQRQNTDANNNWPQAANARIAFCLSSITRTYTDSLSFSPFGFSMFDSNTGGADIWKNYLNIYVCNLDLFANSVLGTAPFPGYYAAYDGVVLDFRVTGRQGNLIQNYDLGRTCTHEVGHWLDLEHVWGLGNGSCSTDDNISDTPNSAGAYDACYTGSSCGSLDMSENFMDYHFDSCMNLFTQGQANRMIAAINIYRTYLKNHNKCNDCLSSFNINFNLQNKTKNITYNGVITAQNDITNNSDVDYYAKNKITLNSGFSVDQTSKFKAAITSNCGG